MQHLADRLVRILQPQLWRDLDGAETETEPRGPAIDFRAGCARRSEAEVGDRNNREADLRPAPGNREFSLPENNAGQVSDTAVRRPQGPMEVAALPKAPSVIISGRPARVSG